MPSTCGSRRPASAGFPVAVDLRTAVLEGVNLAYVSDRQHRVFVYAVVEAVDSRIAMRTSVVTLPRCCCPNPCLPSLCTVCVPIN